MSTVGQEDGRFLVPASRLAAVWAFGYALFRWYYVLGGTFVMHGTPVSMA